MKYWTKHGILFQVPANASWDYASQDRSVANQAGVDPKSRSFAVSAQSGLFVVRSVKKKK